MKSPFKFLDSYTLADREIFFGRDREIEELYHRVFESKTMLVYGVSGTGKSSLIHCGLANKFSETDWLPIVIRWGGNMIESMAAGIRSNSLTVQQSKFGNPADFKKGVRSLYLDHYKPVFFIFDQFEELFIFGDKEERRAFIQIVKSLIESDLQCRLIFVIREEYMAGFAEFEKNIPAIFQNRVRIEKMSHINALAAIKEPCRVFNIIVEEGFAESLLEKLSPESKDVELTYLQVFLDKIFRLAKQSTSPPGGKLKGGSSDSQESGGGVTFSLALLSQTGNVSDLLGSFLDEQIALMEDPETAMTILKAFVSGKGTKRPASDQEALDNVRSIGKKISSETVKDLIQSFVKLRVLRDKNDNGRYELRHDALAEKVYEKFSTAEKELLEIGQFIENSYQSYCKRNVLLSNDDLVYISNKDTLLNLKPELQSFLQASRKHQLDKTNTVRRLTIASAFVFILLITILGYYIVNRLSVNNSNSLAIISIDQTQDPVESLRQAKRAWKMNPGVLPKKALIKAFNIILEFPEKDSAMKAISEPYKFVFEKSPLDIEFANCAKNDKFLFGYGDSLLFIWNIKGQIERIIKTAHFPVIDMKLSDDASYIGAVGSDSVLTVWSADGNIQFSQKIYYNKLNTRQIFKFTKGDNVVAIAKGHDAVIFDINGNKLQQFDKHSGCVNAVDISFDDKFIATSSSDRTINIWYYNAQKSLYNPYRSLAWHRDTIWSVSFSSGKDYNVISASADSMAIIGNINDNKFYRFTGDKPFCFAKFTPADWGFVVTNYERIGSDLKNLIYSEEFRNPDPRGRIRNIYGISNAAIKSYNYMSGFSYLSFSREDNFFASGDQNQYYLVENRLSFEYEKAHNFILLNLKGSKPFFTNDGKAIFSIEGKTLLKYLIDVDTILNLIESLDQ
jgi:hypothetical protein